MCHTPIKPSASVPTSAACDGQPNPAQTQPHSPRVEPATDTDTDTHHGQQGPVGDEVHLSDKKSESDGLSRRKGLDNLNCSASGDTAGPSCSLEGNHCNERDWEYEQRTNQSRGANSPRDFDREPL